jgi:hypothetical protein
MRQNCENDGSNPPGTGTEEKMDKVSQEVFVFNGEKKDHVWDC